MDEENPYRSPSEECPPIGPREKPGVGHALFSFGGRIPRRMWWVGAIGTYAVYVGSFVFVSPLIGEDVAGIFMVVFLIPYLWVTFAIHVKRWHDRDKSGWWMLIGLIPYVGALWTIVELGCLRGTEGPNRFGDDPT